MPEKSKCDCKEYKKARKERDKLKAELKSIRHWADRIQELKARVTQLEKEKNSTFVKYGPPERSLTPQQKKQIRDDVKRVKKQLGLIQGNDARIRKVRVLGPRLKRLAHSKGMKNEDLVLVTTTIHEGRPPTYELKKVEGSPTDWLLEQAKDKTCDNCDQSWKQCFPSDRPCDHWKPIVSTRPVGPKGFMWESPRPWIVNGVCHNDGGKNICDLKYACDGCPYGPNSPKPEPDLGKKTWGSMKYSKKYQKKA